MHVVIVGGGFGGVKTALELSKRQIGKITLISDHAYFLHHATLYATATGRSTEESVIPLRTIFADHPNVEVIEDRVETIDPSRKLISSSKIDYHYDKLVLALGSVTSYFNIKGVAQHAYGIKTLDEVLAFHEHIHDEVVQQKLDKEYFVIGGGLTGVELAGALTQYLESLKLIFRLKNAHPKVVLVEAKERILPHLSKTASRVVTRELVKQGVRVLTNHKVTSLDDDSIVIEGRSRPTTTAVWTSGVAPHPFFAQNKGYFSLSQDGRVNVSPYLEALDDVYVIGDANIVHTHAMAGHAFNQAKQVAANIARLAVKQPQRPYRPNHPAVAIPVGDQWGYVEWGGTYIAGKPGKAARRLIELKGYKEILPLHKAVPIWRSHDTSEVNDLI
jgi:NADH dehydrogenase